MIYWAIFLLLPRHSIVNIVDIDTFRFRSDRLVPEITAGVFVRYRIFKLPLKKNGRAHSDDCTLSRRLPTCSYQKERKKERILFTVLA